MAELIVILVFISLYGLSFMGEKTGERYFVSAFIIHLGYIAFRAWFLGRPPVTERHDIPPGDRRLCRRRLFVFQRRIPVPPVEVLPILRHLCFFGLFQERMDTIEPHMNTPCSLCM